MRQESLPKATATTMMMEAFAARNSAAGLPPYLQRRRQWIAWRPW